MRLSAWQYPYQAALQTRWDCDFYDGGISALANVERKYGLHGQYFVVTGLVDDDGNTLKVAQNRGALFGSHNDVHLGPDVETHGRGRREPNRLHSTSCEVGPASRPNVWVAPAYRSILDTSFEVVAAQGIKTAGEQNFGPFPHFTLSMTKPDTHYDLLQIPTSEWLPSSATSADERARMELIPEEQMPDVVDFFYSFGGLINLYGHPYYGNDTKLEAAAVPGSVQGRRVVHGRGFDLQLVEAARPSRHDAAGHWPGVRWTVPRDAES